MKHLKTFAAALSALACVSCTTFSPVNVGGGMDGGAVRRYAEFIKSDDAQKLQGAGGPWILIVRDAAIPGRDGGGGHAISMSRHEAKAGPGAAFSQAFEENGGYSVEISFRSGVSESPFGSEILDLELSIGVYRQTAQGDSASAQYSDRKSSSGQIVLDGAAGLTLLGCVTKYAYPAIGTEFFVFLAK